MICQGIFKNLSLDWRTRKPEITLQLDARPEDVENLKCELKEGLLSVELKKYRKRRSLDANAYYWQLIGKLADKLSRSTAYLHNHMLRCYGQIEVIDDQGVYIVIPDTDAAQKRVDEAETYHLKPTSQVKPGRDGNMYRTYMMLRGSSSYNTKEMSTLIDGLVGECREQGIETLTPVELERMMIAYSKKHNAEG